MNTNPLRDFIAEDCVIEPGATVLVVEFHGQLQSWWAKHWKAYPDYTMHPKWIEAMLTSMGIGRARAIGGDVYVGVAINSPYSWRPQIVLVPRRSIWRR